MECCMPPAPGFSPAHGDTGDNRQTGLMQEEAYDNRTEMSPYYRDPLRDGPGRRAGEGDSYTHTSWDPQEPPLRPGRSWDLYSLQEARFGGSNRGGSSEEGNISYSAMFALWHLHPAELSGLNYYESIYALVSLRLI